ncbi:MAG: hypothetical protein ABS68_01035 [Niastella sp. SCN 39-18]|nr:MAG: hypothetical protein ABS68_01035 [Niastella sp. SCN 39-18]
MIKKIAIKRKCPFGTTLTPAPIPVGTNRGEEIVYDGTVYFCNKIFGKYDRTKEQMAQVARSGKHSSILGSLFRL